MEGLSVQQLALVAVAVGVMAFVLAARFQAAFLAVMLMFFAASIAIPTDWMDRPVMSWMAGVHIRRSEIFLGSGMLLWIAALFHAPQIKASRVPMPAACLLLIALYASFLKLSVGGNINDGLLSALFAVGTIMSAMYVFPSLIQSREGALNLIRSITLVSGVWIAACFMQFLVRPMVLTVSGGGVRFNGMLSNPQHAGAYLAIVITSGLFLTFNETKLTLRPLWLAVTGVNALLLLWTGSRTGLGMAMIGAISILATRIGWGVVFLPIVAALGSAVYSSISQVMSVDLTRLSIAGDTRTGVWIRLWEQFVQNPVFGTIASDVDLQFSENSLLMGLANYGIFMGLIVLALYVSCVHMVWRLWSARSKFEGVDRRLIDLVIGYIALYCAGSMFEGYALSRVSSNLVGIVLFTSVGMWLLEQARSIEPAPQPIRAGEGLSDTSVLSGTLSDTALAAEALSSSSTRTLIGPDVEPERPRGFVSLHRPPPSGPSTAS